MSASSTVAAIGAAADPDPWPTLIAFDDHALPALDPAALPSWLGDYVVALARATETPPELPIGMALAVAATCSARRLLIEGAPGYREPTNLWVVVALEPGNRKSAVESAAKAPLLGWEEMRAQALAPEIAEARSRRKTVEARVKSLRAATTKATTKPADASRFAEELAELERTVPEVPVSPRLWTADATPERLGTLLAEHDECMSLLSSEGGIFDVLAGRYSKGAPNLDLVLKAHAGDADLVDRLSRESVRLRFPRLSMGLSPQPDVLRSLADQPGFAGRGLLARILWLVPRSPLGHRTLDGPPVPAPVRDRYAAGIAAMLGWPEPARGECHVLHLDDDARAEWKAFGAEIEPRMRDGGTLEHYRGWAGKAPGAALRLAGVLHGVEHAHGEPWAHRVGGATMNAALALLATIMQHSTTVLAAMGEDVEQQRAQQVLDWLERQRRSACTVRDVHVAMKHRLTRVAQVRAALAVLEERGYVRTLESEPSEGGRPRSPTVQVRPGLWS